MQRVPSFLLAVGLLVVIGCGDERTADDSGGTEGPRFEEGFVEVEPGLRLYYRVIGDGEEKVVVPAGFYLEDVLSHVARGRTVIFYDMRDRGRSDSVADLSRVELPEDVADLEALRVHFGLETMSLIGWSYLGTMVVVYALEHPGRVARVVQIGPTPPRSSPPYAGDAARKYRAVLDTAGLRRLEELESAGVKTSEPERFYEEYWRVYKPTLFGDPAKVAWYEMPPADLPNEWVHELEAHFQAKYESLDDYDLRQPASELEVPVLTIHGTEDRNAPFEGGLEWSAALPNARFLAVEGSAHMPFVEQPERVETAIDVFLRGYWPEGAIDIEPR